MKKSEFMYLTDSKAVTILSTSMTMLSTERGILNIALWHLKANPVAYALFI